MPRQMKKVRREVKPEPYRCPVCGGKGAVPQGFYTGQTEATGAEPCRTCQATGIVWTPEVKEKVAERP
jgi:hypothetical protein